MNPDTGHLVRELSMLDEAKRMLYKPVPDSLLALAEKELASRQETMVNMRRRNELVRWAKSVRTKNRARNKIAKKSRAKNR